MNLAAQLRAQAQARWPGASVFARGEKYIIHQHPTNPQKRMVDVSLGQIHYGAQLDQEIDTAWVSTSAPEDSPYVRKMDLADYKALFGNGNLLFTPAFPFRYINPATGDFISWQANPNLQWTNSSNSVANIGLTKQAIEAQIDDDELFFPGVYGTGFDFYLELQTSRLQKRLEILSSAALGTPPQSIIDGGNPVAMLSFQFQRSAGVSIWVDGVQWGEATGQGNAVATVNTVEFRNSQGAVLWGMPSAWVRDANGDEPVGVVTRFRRAGPSFFVEFRIPWPWLQTAVYPVTVDPTVDTQVAAGADDAHETDDGATFSGTATAVRADSNTAAGSRQNAGTRFILTGPASGDTIDVAYCPVHALNTASDDPNCEIYCEDVDNAANYTTTADVTSRVRTTAFTTWTATAIGTGEVNSPSIVSAVQEVIDRAGWASGNALNVIWHGKSDANFSFRPDSYEGSTTECIKLHVEYTAGAAGYTLALETGAFTLTGIAVGLKRGYPLPMGVGGFSLTGNAASLEFGRVITAGTGSFTLTGNDAGLFRGYPLTLEAGAFSLTGNALGVLAARRLGLEAGAFSLVGNDVNLTKGRTLVLDTGSFALIGNDTGLLAGRRLGLEVGAFSVTGNSAGLLRGYPLTLEMGAFSLTGNDLGVKAGRKLGLEAGTFVLTGNAANLLRGHLLALGTGAFTLTGNDVAFTVGGGGGGAFALVLETGSFALNGNAAGLRAGRLLGLEVDNFVLTGSDAGLRHGYRAGMETGSFLITGNDAGFLAARTIAAETGGLVLTGNNAGMLKGFGLSAETGAFVLSGNAVGLARIYVLVAGAGSFVMTGYAVGFTFSGIVIEVIRISLFANPAPFMTLKANATPEIRLRIKDFV